MRDYPERIAKFGGDRPKSADEFQAVAATPTLHARTGVAMAGDTEGDHVKSGLDQGPDEAAELSTPAAPAVHQVDRMSLAPGFHRDGSARDVDHRTNARSGAFVAASAGIVWQGAPEVDRQSGAGPRADSFQHCECRPKFRYLQTCTNDRAFSAVDCRRAHDWSLRSGVWQQVRTAGGPRPVGLRTP